MFTLLDLKSKQDFQRVLKNLPNTNLRLPPHQSSLGAASGSQDKDRVARLLAPNTPTPCPHSFGAKSLLLLLFSLLAVFLTLRRLSCPSQSCHTCCFLGLPHPDKSYGFQPHVPMAKEASLVQSPIKLVIT